MHHMYDTIIVTIKSDVKVNSFQIYDPMIERYIQLEQIILNKYK